MALGSCVRACVHQWNVVEAGETSPLRSHDEETHRRRWRVQLRALGKEDWGLPRCRRRTAAGVVVKRCSVDRKQCRVEPIRRRSHTVAAAAPARSRDSGGHGRFLLLRPLPLLQSPPLLDSAWIGKGRASTPVQSIGVLSSAPMSSNGVRRCSAPPFLLLSSSPPFLGLGGGLENWTSHQRQRRRGDRNPRAPGVSSYSRPRSWRAADG